MAGAIKRDKTKYQRVHSNYNLILTLSNFGLTFYLKSILMSKQMLSLITVTVRNVDGIVNGAPVQSDYDLSFRPFLINLAAATT